MRLCQYKNIAGIPGQGFHTHYGGLALLDVLATILLALFAAKLTNISPVVAVICAFVLGIFAHWLFCVDTELNKFLGL